jgi:hypothetical protein
MAPSATGVAIIWEQYPTGAAQEQVTFSTVASDGSVEVTPTRIYDGNVESTRLASDGAGFVAVVDPSAAAIVAIGIDSVGQVTDSNTLSGVAYDHDSVEISGQHWAAYRRSISGSDDLISYKTFDGAGNNLSAELDMAASIAGVQRDPQLAAVSDGVWLAFVVNDSSVYLQKHDAAGAVVIPAFEAMSGLSSAGIGLAASDEGVLLVAETSVVAAPERVLYRTFDNTGQPNIGALPMPINREESQTYDMIAVGGTGYVVAEDDSTTALARIVLRRVELATGNTVEEVLSAPSVDALCPSIAVAGDRLAVSFRSRLPEAVRQLVFVDL